MKKLLLFTLAWYFLSVTYASSSLIVGGSVGQDHLHMQNSYDTVPLTSSDNIPQYNVLSDTSPEGFWGVNLAIEKSVSKNNLWQFGLGYYSRDNLSISGSVYSGSDPAYHNSNFSYKVKHSRLMLEGKWLYRIWRGLLPYVWGGLGAAWNKAYDYEQVPLSEVIIVPRDLFSDNSQTELTYGIGAGIDLALSSHIRLGVGYRYINLGEAKLGETTTQKTDDTLNLGDFFASEVIAQLSFVY